MEMHNVRDVVKHMYQSPAWSQKVAKMPDNQVFAIYMRQLQKRKEVAPQFQQLSFDDIKEVNAP